MELKMLVIDILFYFFFELNHRLVDTEEVLGLASPVLGLARQILGFGLKAKSLALPWS